MRRQWSGAVRVDRRGERSVGTENRMRRQWSSMGLRLLGRTGPVGTENRMRRQWSIPTSVRGGGRVVVRGCCSRNGEQGAEAVEPTRRAARRAGVLQSERRTGCGGSGAPSSGGSSCRGAAVGTENRMRRQWSNSSAYSPSVSSKSERRTGCGGSGARKREPRSSRRDTSERRTGCGGSGARSPRAASCTLITSRNGEEEAEAVEPGRARGQTGRRRGGRNGEQDAEAVELSYHYRQLTDERRSERRTGCGGSGAGSMTSGRRTRRVVGTENRMRRQWSDTYFGLCRQAAEVGTENRMRRQWSCSSGTLVGQCVRASERRTGCGGSGAARYGRSIGHPGLVGTENRMRRQWSLRA